MTDTAFTLTDFLAVEDSSEVLDVACLQTGIPLWSQLRATYLRTLMSDLLYSTPLVGKRPGRASALAPVTTLLRSSIWNARSTMAGGAAADILIVASGVGHQLVSGRWFNRLADHLALAHESTTVLEGHFEWRWPSPRANNRVLYHSPLQAAATLRGRASLRRTHRDHGEAFLELVDARAQRLTGVDATRHRRSLGPWLARKIAEMPHRLAMYRRLLRRIRPSVLLVEEGCYGPAAPLIVAAKEAGVVTAEFQHGAVANGHIAYNFAPATRNHAGYVATLPEYFLGYGDWWLDQINAPVKKVAIGNPHRDFRLTEFDNNRPRTDILLLSDGTEFARYADLAEDISRTASAGSWRVVVRPHPHERSAVLSSGRYGGKCAVDANPDLYDSLATARAVVSEVSTGVFEAAGLVDQLFLWNTPKSRFAFPHHPFETFSSAAELCNLLMAGRGDLGSAAVDSIWRPGWRSNYERFLTLCAATRK